LRDRSFFVLVNNFISKRWNSAISELFIVTYVSPDQIHSEDEDIDIQEGPIDLESGNTQGYLCPGQLLLCIFSEVRGYWRWREKGTCWLLE